MEQRLRRAGVLLAVTATLILAGCSGGPGSVGSDPEAGSTTESPSTSVTTPPSPGHPTRAPAYRSYVALGDSYTAGPLLPRSQIAHGCFRSALDYPHLLARTVRAHTFRDVSCSGATTDDLLASQHTAFGMSVAPQLDAVRRGTRLVTVGLGGNDFGLFSTLAGTCLQVASTAPRGAPCTAALRRSDPELLEQVRSIGDRVAAGLRAVSARAPRARVVLVGYLRLAPTSGSCRRLPLAAGDDALVGRVSRVLRDAMRSAARETGAMFVDMYAASAGHDACSAHPWVNGTSTQRHPVAAYHPLPAGMRATADAIVAALAR